MAYHKHMCLHVCMQIAAYLGRVRAHLASNVGPRTALSEIESTRMLTAAAEKTILDSLKDLDMMLQAEAKGGLVLPRDGLMVAQQ